MTYEDIDKLADEYADKECAMSRHTGKKLKQLHEDKIIEFYDVFGFLVERFCIIPKSKVKEKYALAKMGYTECEGLELGYVMDALEDIFGKDTFEEEGK